MTSTLSNTMVPEPAMPRVSAAEKERRGTAASEPAAPGDRKGLTMTTPRLETTERYHCSSRRSHHEEDTYPLLLGDLEGGEEDVSLIP